MPKTTQTRRVRSTAVAKWVSAALHLLAAMVSSGAMAAPDAAGCWRELEFSAGNRWASAAVSLRYSSQDSTTAGEQLLHPEGVEAPLGPSASTSLLKIRFAAMMSHGTLSLWYDPASNGLLQMQRIAEGREARRKVHRVLANGIWRERRAPNGNAGNSRPEDWEVRSRSVIPYPAGLPQGTPVLAPEMLIAAATRLVEQPGNAKQEYLVLADTHFHRVRLQALPERTIEASVRIEQAGANRSLTGERTVRRIALIHEAVDSRTDEDPLRLLELEGDLQIAIDTQTLLPLRVQGTWLRVGTVPATLVRARLEPGCNG